MGQPPTTKATTGYADADDDDDDHHHHEYFDYYKADEENPNAAGILSNISGQTTFSEKYAVDDQSLQFLFLSHHVTSIRAPLLGLGFLLFWQTLSQSPQSLISPQTEDSKNQLRQTQHPNSTSNPGP